MLTTILNFFGGFGRRRQLKQRALLRYHDGTTWRYADPFRAWRDLVNPSVCGFNLAEHGPMVDQGIEPFTTNCIEAICRVFELKRFDPATGEGVTDWEALGVAHQLRDYIDEVKKNTSGSQTTPEPGGSMPRSDSSETAAPTEPTRPTGDSGSMPIGSSCAAPTAPERPSEQPLTMGSI